jgi:oxygen-dependent protoporphyrinogen oxidase
LHIDSGTALKRCAIIGAGISGLSAAYYLGKSPTPFDIDVYDAQERPGGIMQSEVISGCIIDTGPDSFLTQKTAAFELIEDLQLSGELIGSNDESRLTWIFQDGKLKRLPDGFYFVAPTKFQPFLHSDLLTWPGKLSVISDLFALPEHEDLSVGEFTQRRFGEEILHQITEPLVAGVYGSDAERLSLKSALPAIWEMQQRGSILWNSRKREAKSSASLFTTLKRGMGSLSDAIYERSAAIHWKFGRYVAEVSRSGESWIVENEPYDVLLLAASSLPKIRTDVGERIGSVYESIRRNSAVVIAMTFADLELKGFGWLVPASERHSVLACTYVTNKFAGRTPPGKFLIRLFIGGEHANEWINRTDEEVYGEALSEFRRITGVQTSPLFYKIYRWSAAMPEYAVNHDKKIAAIELLCRAEMNLYITGNAIAGIGISDCIAHAKKIVNEAFHKQGGTEK